MQKKDSILKLLAQRVSKPLRTITRVRAGSLENLTLLQRLGLAFLVVTLLGASTSVVGVWFANLAAQSVAQVQRGSSQIQAIERLQREWYGLISSVDLLLLTRSLAGLQTELQTNLTNFNEQFAVVRNSVTQQGLYAAGGNQSSQERARQIIQDIEQITIELEQIIREFTNLVRAGRWGSAQTLRYARLSSLQLRLQENLNLLNQMIQDDVEQSVAAAQRTQALARGVWIAAAILALMFSLGISWFSSQAIAGPINQLIGEVKAVTDVGRSVSGSSISQSFGQIHPPDRKDEIGDVWRAFATMTEWLSEAYQNMEARVIERTQALERRSQQVQAAAEVARDITVGKVEQEGAQQTGAGLNNLLDKAVNLVRERFGYYHAGVFLIDDRGEYAVLRAATGEAGQQMLARSHRLRVGEVGLVGFVAESGLPRIALDVGKDAVHFRNPLLPETRSEVALPLRTGDQTIGVLDVQSQESGAFDEQDMVILQIIADQLSTAIENTRLFNELGIRLQELENFYVGYGRQSWERIAKMGKISGIEYDSQGVRPLEHNAADGNESAMDDSSTTTERYRFPITLRGEVIANLDIWAGNDALSSDDILMLNTYTSRVSQVLESARLFSESQQRASREQLLNELTSTLVRSIDPQSVLLAAAQQLERLPSVAKAAVYLSLDDKDQQDNKDREA